MFIRILIDVYTHLPDFLAHIRPRDLSLVLFINRTSFDPLNESPNTYYNLPKKKLCNS